MSSGQALCQQCSSARATVHCTKCEVDYCDQCNEIIHKSAMRNHERVRIEDKKMKLRCKHHPDEDVRFWCTIDRRLICRDCVLQHKDHIIQDLNTAAQHAKQVFSTIIKEQNIKQEKLHKHKDALKRAVKQQQENFEEVMNEIHKLTNDLVDVNDMRLKELEAELVKREMEMNEVKKLKENLARLMKSEDEIEVMKMRQDVEDEESDDERRMRVEWERMKIEREGERGHIKRLTITTHTVTEWNGEEEEEKRIEKQDESTVLEETRSEVTTQTIPSGEYLFVVGGCDGPNTVNTVQAYNSSTNTWSCVSPMTKPRRFHGIGVMSGCLFAVGGDDGENTLKTVEKFDPSTNTWSLIAPMNTARMNHGVGVVKRHLFAVGGHDGETMLNTVERYDPSTNTWSFVSPMTKPRSHHGVGVLNGCLFAVGGGAGATALSTVERYDPSSNTWSLVSPMTKPRRYHGIGVVNGCLFAVGGQAGFFVSLQSIEIFNPTANTWSSLESQMSMPRDGHGVGVMNGCLFVVGGNEHGTVEKYNVSTKKWSEVAPMPMPRANHGVGVLKL